MSDHWQDNLRKRMDLHEETAPEGLWKDIEQRIYTSGLVHNVKPRRKIILWSLSSVAAAVAILILVLFPFNNQSPLLPTTEVVVSEIIDHTDVTESKELAESLETESVVALKPIEKKLISQSKQIVTQSKQLSSQSEHLTAQSTQHTAQPNQDATPQQHNNAPAQLTTEEGDKVRLNEVDKENELQPSNQLLAISTMSKSLRESRWQTNLSMSNVPSSSSDTQMGFATFAQQETVEDQYAFMSQYTRSDTYTEIDHNLPIAVGLTFRYNLNQRWGISSGLTYSLLTSKLRSESVNYFYDDRQTLHYLGVPLNFDYKLWQNNNFSTYISAGGLVEKNIAGKLSSDYYIDNKLQSSTDEKITSKQLQWSINSAIGVEYRIADNIGIYAEPGVAYYFKNSSKIETIYKEQPFNFNLRLGLRINFNN